MSSDKVLVVNNDNKVGYKTITSGSSIRYKDIARRLRTSDVERFYKVKPVLASYKADYLDPDHEWQGVKMPMLIAEDIDAMFPDSVRHTMDGLVDDYTDHVIVAVHQKMLIDLHSEIKKLKKEIESLKKAMA